MIRLIAAIDRKRGLADDRGIPWQGKLPSDAAYFREQTAEGMIVMGFRTYEEFAQPLHGRTNYVVSRSADSTLRPGFEVVGALDPFLVGHGDQTVWIIGGAGLYEAALPSADELYLTQLDDDFRCTKFFPDFEQEFRLEPGAEELVENDISFRFEIWTRRPRTS